MPWDGSGTEEGCQLSTGRGGGGQSLCIGPPLREERGVQGRGGAQSHGRARRLGRGRALGAERFYVTLNITSFQGSLQAVFPTVRPGADQWHSGGKGSKSVVVLLAHSCLAPCNPMDCSPPGASVCGIFQARILEWVAMPSSGGSS